eukprot:COSAG02_NODE_2100_length_9827_cov_18.167352_8_plen_69_part_00
MVMVLLTNRLWRFLWRGPLLISATNGAKLPPLRATKRPTNRTIATAALDDRASVFQESEDDDGDDEME